MKKIGIMGGTFNPPHLGHLISAENVKNSLKLSKIIFIPTGNIYYKDTKDTADAIHRLNMTRLLVGGKDDFCVSDIEVKAEGYSYTCETLEKLKEIYPEDELYFIVGADSLDYIDRWKEPDKIFALSKIVAVGRAGFTDDQIRKKAEELNALYKAEIIFLETEHIDVSSTEIRNAVRNGKPVCKMVTKDVEEYIIKNNLYKNGDTDDGN